MCILKITFYSLTHSKLYREGVGRLIQLAVEQAKNTNPEIKIGVRASLVAMQNQFVNLTNGN